VTNVTASDHTKRTALRLLSKGLVTQSEAARLAGVSRQLMRAWAFDIKPFRRSEHLKRLWSLTKWRLR
jgi:hypothetical protein